MIVSFEGQMGQGKTMDAVALVYTDAVQRQVKVISNIHLNLPPEIPYKYLTTKEFVEYMKDTDNVEMNDCNVLFDETYQIMESRRGGSSVVLLFDYYMLQTRKRRADLYVCFHHIDSVDKRLRRQIDYRGSCRMRNEDPCKQCEGTGYVEEGRKTINEKKLALYKGNGTLLPVMVKSSSTYQGKVAYNVINLLDMDKKMVVNQSDLYFKPAVDKNEWRSIFDFMLKENEDGYQALCQRCMGYKKTGWSTVRFRDLKAGNPPKTLRVFGPAVWPLYDTEERIPLTKQQLRVKEDDL